MLPTKQVSLRLGHDIIGFLEKEATADQRSLAFIVTALVRAEIERKARAKKSQTNSQSNHESST